MSEQNAQIAITVEEYDKYNKLVKNKYNSVVARKIDDYKIFWTSNFDQKRVATLEKINGIVSFRLGAQQTPQEYKKGNYDANYRSKTKSNR